METAVPEEQAKKQQRDKRMPPGASSHEQPPAAVPVFFQLWVKIQKLTTMNLTGYWYLRRTMPLMLKLSRLLR